MGVDREIGLSSLDGSNISPMVLIESVLYDSKHIESPFLESDNFFRMYLPCILFPFRSVCNVWSLRMEKIVRPSMEIPEQEVKN